MSGVAANTSTTFVTLQPLISVDSNSAAPSLRCLKAAMQVLRTFQHFGKQIIPSLTTLLVHIATIPYYRLYQFNTRSPMRNIAKLASEAPPDDAKLLHALLSWRSRKITEFQFTTISCTVLAAAVIGAFSWTTVEEAHWLTHGLWHSSLILAVLGILLSASGVTVLYILGPTQTTIKPYRSRLILQRYNPLLLSRSNDSSQLFVPRRKMMFTWQGPLMFMSYSVCTFLGGLTILVCTPLIRYQHGDNWNSGHNIAVVYLVVMTLAGALFVFCSFWIYHYVSPGVDGEDHFAENRLWNEEDGNEINLRELSGRGLLTPIGEGRPATMHYRPRAAQEEESKGGQRE
ncbi:hypothetical protein DPSP01_009993 [Paraphaeosphaeria sporulosa]|uniref:Uncharacterized protein n=1 Tax=Paraphaeosphaeria sporulosa TaxID=1460663 RepID=A0A177CEB2_9PLEO|nr:uncharacterized protein CC84DRAFT_1259287 [Paraphaeosphaeria sporulosa]OAG05973.1 hypothetical protein CC84DRAFT_1259287 [Paraphaeosphaeria sporulosa]